MHPKLGFLIADGARGRLIVRHSSGAYETVRTVHDAVKEEASPGERTGHHERDRFVGALVEMLDEAVAADGLFEGLVLVAPTRLIGEIKPRLGQAATARLVRALAKDLTKMPEGELHARLEHISLAPVQS